MALNDNSTLKLDGGTFYTAPVGTALPTDLNTIPVAWVNLGHTTLDDILAPERDGGDETILGSLQNRNLRVSKAKVTETFKIKSLQWDLDSLKNYYGTGLTVIDSKWVGIPSAQTPVEKAFLAVFTDGANKFAVYMAKASISGDEAWALGGTDELNSLPLKVTPLQHGSNTWTVALTPLGGTA